MDAEPFCHRTPGRITEPARSAAAVGRGCTHSCKNARSGSRGPTVIDRGPPPLRGTLSRRPRSRTADRVPFPSDHIGVAHPPTRRMRWLTRRSSPPPPTTSTPTTTCYTPRRSSTMSRPIRHQAGVRSRGLPGSPSEVRTSGGRPASTVSPAVARCRQLSRDAWIGAGRSGFGRSTGNG